jgi:hypothetical protein
VEELTVDMPDVEASAVCMCDGVLASVRLPPLSPVLVVLVAAAGGVSVEDVPVGADLSEVEVEPCPLESVLDEATARGGVEDVLTSVDVDTDVAMVVELGWV